MMFQFHHKTIELIAQQKNNETIQLMEFAWFGFISDRLECGLSVRLSLCRKIIDFNFYFLSIPMRHHNSLFIFRSTRGTDVF